MPCLWAAWTELASLNADYDALVAAVPLPQHWMQVGWLPQHWRPG